MPRRTIVSAIFLFVLLLAACAPEPRDPGSTVKGVRFTRAQIEEGRVLYEQTCAACHGINGEGQFPADPLQPDATGRYGAPPHNEIGHTWHHTDELILRYITEGGFADPNRFYTMPNFGTIYNRDQAALIAAYIKTMWTEEQRIYQHHMTEEEEREIARLQSEANN